MQFPLSSLNFSNPQGIGPPFTMRYDRISYLFFVPVGLLKEGKVGRERDAFTVALSKTCTFEIAWKEVIHFGHSENGFFLFVKVLFWVPF